MLNGTEGMLTGLLALFLFGDIPADKDHDTLFGPAHFFEVVQIFAADPVHRNLLKREST